MGLAIALRGKGAVEAESLAELVVAGFPNTCRPTTFSPACAKMGQLEGAQAVLQQAAAISPNNAVRQRVVGDVAMRNGNLDVAEKAYGKVLERHRGSSLKQVDDYANLSRVMLDKGHAAGATGDPGTEARLAWQQAGRVRGHRARQSVPAGRGRTGEGEACRRAGAAPA